MLPVHQNQRLNGNSIQYFFFISLLKFCSKFRFKDGVEFEPLSSPSKYNVEYQRNGLIRFEIKNVEQKDLGEYRCHAMNIHGYDNSIASLKFECKPSSLMSSLLIEENHRQFKQMIPELQPLTYTLTLLCMLASLLVIFNLRWSPDFPCDTALDRVQEFIFQCISDSCNNQKSK